MSELDRRRLLAGGLAGAGTATLGGCDQLARNETVHSALEQTEQLTQAAQRLLIDRQALAPEYAEADIAPAFRANGSTNPADANYRRHVEAGFADWRLQVQGLVERPLSLSLAELRAAPSRTQITRHDCVEGWSCIGKWKGVPLATLLTRARVRPEARYIVFHCADALDQQPNGDRYYESIDRIDAWHPQTILAYEMNDQVLPVAHGAPVRLRVERQLGYKHAKYVMRIEAVRSFAHIGGGHGGYWEDRGYEWFAGI